LEEEEEEEEQQAPSSATPTNTERQARRARRSDHALTPSSSFDLSDEERDAAASRLRAAMAAGFRGFAPPAALQAKAEAQAQATAAEAALLRLEEGAPPSSSGFGGGPSAPVVRLFNHGVEAARVRRAIEDAGLSSRVALAPTLAEATAIVCVKASPGGKPLPTGQAARTAKNMGVPLVIAGRTMTAATLRRALAPLLAPPSSSSSKAIGSGGEGEGEEEAAAA